MWLEKFPVHFLYKIKVSEVFSFLIRNSRVFFKFFGGRNKEANDKMISFCRARRILHPQGYVAIFNFQEKRVSSPNHLFKYILLDLQQNFYWTAIRFLDPRAACTRTAWLVDLPFFIPGNNRLPRNACQGGNSKIFKTFINLLRRAVKNSYSYCSTTRPVEAIFLLLDVENTQFYQTSIRKRLLDIHLTEIHRLADVGCTYTTFGEGARGGGFAIVEYNFADVQNTREEKQSSRPTGKVRISQWKIKGKMRNDIERI